MKNKWMKCYSLLCLLVICSIISGSVGRLLAEAAPEKEVNSVNISENTVYVGGMPVGIYMETKGVLVLSTQEIQTVDGSVCEPARNLLKSGDYIIEMNHVQISNKESLIQEVEDLETADTALTIRRNGEIIKVKMEAAEVEEDSYKLGIWVRDNVQGLGTITYIDPKGNFGALGHGIHDVDISTLIDVEEGKLYKTNIRSITKGEDGFPGSMEGIIVYNSTNKLGTITENKETGIYGILDDSEEMMSELAEVEIASVEEIETGPAFIRCSIDGAIGEYDVEITKVDLNATEVNKGIMLQVTDEELLEKTGGIIQGMSGSPIIQDEKLVGAVTHVLVNDPTRGYGIFIENMLEH